VNESDDRTFERFVRRLAAIEAEVKDPPPFGVGRLAPRGANIGLRVASLSIARLMAVLVLIVGVAVAAPIVGGGPSTPPTSTAAAVVPGTSPSPALPISPAPSDMALIPLDPAIAPSDLSGPCQTVVTMDDRALTTIEQDAANATAVVIGTVTGVGKAQWNTALGDRPNGDSIGPSQVFRLVRVDVETVVKGSVPTVLTLWIPGGAIGCHGFWGGIRGIGRPDIGSRYAFFLGNGASRTRRALPGVVPSWQIWSIDGDRVTTESEGSVPLATFIDRASAVP
jgi:hypothetical protein